MDELSLQKLAFFQKITPECHWYSNIQNCELLTFKSLAKLAGLSYEIVSPAFTPNGTLFLDGVAIFIPDSDYKNGKLEAYFTYADTFCKKYWNQLKEKGYDMDLFLTGNYRIFLGCEEYYGLIPEKNEKDSMPEK